MFRIILLLLLLSSTSIANEKVYPAPSNVIVISIYDGDTFTVDIPEWPDIIGKRISIRIANIDTPELRDNRPKIKELAQKAKMFTVEKLRTAKKIELKNLQRDKYFRIVADVFVNDENLGNLLVQNNLAQKYDGKTKVKWK